MGKSGGGSFTKKIVGGATLGMSTGGLSGMSPSGAFDIVGDITGSNRAADAAQQAAMAQQEMARQTRQDVLAQGKKGELEAARIEREAMSLAEASPQELAALSRSYSSAEGALNREERLLASIDPALMEASSQALKLLRGETADVNKPLNDMRNSQRQELVNSLRGQYGPGAESSSIGQKALQQFDMESNSMFQQNQQGSLANVFGIASSDFGARAQRGIAGLQQVGQGYGALQERKLNTRLNVGDKTLNAGNASLAALAGTSAQMIQSAGAQYTGEALRGQAQQSLVNRGLDIGSSWASRPTPKDGA